MSGAAPFGFVQLEFGHLLGPPDGRYLVRPEPELRAPAGAGTDDLEAILVLGTLGAPERRLLRGRRGRTVEDAEPAPVATSRATVVRATPFAAGRDEAHAWLANLRDDHEAAAAEVGSAVTVLNRALRAHRVAAADPYAAEVSADRAHVVRIGFGPGESVADGRYEEAWELPVRRRGPARSMEAPEERFAALLGGRGRVLACEELVLRARADLDAVRAREAALQARVALEALLAELDEIPESRRATLEGSRATVGRLANAALAAPLDAASHAELTEVVGQMEAALRAHRVKG